jgi:hypothetical protein
MGLAAIIMVVTIVNDEENKIEGRRKSRTSLNGEMQS